MNNIKDYIIGLLIGLIFALLVIGFGLILKELGKKDDKNYNECIKHYSKNYCTKSIYGVY